MLGKILTMLLVDKAGRPCCIKRKTCKVGAVLLGGVVVSRRRGARRFGFQLPIRVSLKFSSLKCACIILIYKLPEGAR